jgi:predicted PurR-regulated permease PerM
MKVRSRRFVAVLAVVLSVSVLVVAFSTPAVAQSPGVIGLLEALANLQESVENLQASVDELEAKLDEHTAAPAVENVRFTPEVLIQASEHLTCGAVNVANQQRSVTIEVIAQLGNVASSIPLILEPGQASIQLLHLNSGNFYCRFTVQNGSRSDIRGVVRVLDAATSITHSLLAAE